MPPAALVSVEDAVAAIKKFISFFIGDKLPPYSATIWKEISTALNRKWTPNHVYHSVKYDRRKILTRARKEMGFDTCIEKVETDSTRNLTKASTDSDASSEDHDHDHAVCFDLVLTSEEWDAIKPMDNVIIETKQYKGKKPQAASIGRRKRLQPGSWTSVIANAFSKQTKLPCAFIFKRAYISNSELSQYYLFIKGQCKSKNCRNNFEGILEKQPDHHQGCTIKVRTRDTRGEQHEQVKRPLKGRNQQIVQKEMIAEGCSNWQKRQARENMVIGEEEPPFIYSSDVLRQAKKERIDLDIGVNPLDRRDLVRAIENISVRAEFKGVITAVGSSPFYVIYISPNQLHVYKKYTQIMKSKTKIMVDATGSLVRKIKRPNGTTTGHIFLYTVVINFEKKTVPVYQMLSESHVTEFIEFWLKQWLRKGAPRPQEVICDYSKALLSALCIAFNNETIKSYVNNWFQKLYHDTPMEIKTCIRVDVAHLLRFISKWKCFASCKHVEIKEFYIRCIARMVESKTLTKFEEILTLTCAVAGHKYSDSQLDCLFAHTVLEARTKLEGFIASPADEDHNINREDSYHVRPIDDEPELASPDEVDAMESNSVQRWVDTCVSTATGARCVGGEINAFYLPEFVTSITKLAKEFVLWTNVVSSARSLRASSACVESYFKDLKTHTLMNKILRADAFLLIHIRNIDGESMIFNSKMTQFERQEQKRKSNLILEDQKQTADEPNLDDSDLMSVENWRGKALQNEGMILEYSYENENQNLKGIEDKDLSMERICLMEHSYYHRKVRDTLDQDTPKTVINFTIHVEDNTMDILQSFDPEFLDNCILNSTPLTFDEFKHTKSDDAVPLKSEVIKVLHIRIFLQKKEVRNQYR